MIVAGTENRPPMLEKSMYNLWLFLYIKGKKNGRMMLESIEKGPLVYSTIEEDGKIYDKKYAELTKQEKLQDDSDVQATNIVLQGIPPDVYSLVNHCKTAKDIMDIVKLLMQGNKCHIKNVNVIQETAKYVSTAGVKLVLLKVIQEMAKYVSTAGVKDISIKDSEITVLKSKLEKISKEKDDLDIKIEKFKNTSQSLDKMIGSQITDNSKRGLGYVSYNAVPPPHTGRFSPLRIDLSHTGLTEFAEPSVQSYGVKPIEVVPQTSSVKISEPVKRNNGAPVIEDWESEGEDKVESPPKIERKTVKPSLDKSRCKDLQRDKMVHGTNHSRVNHSAHTVPKAMLTKTSLKPANFVRPINSKRPNSAVLNAVRANKGKAVKASACWVWRPIKLDSALITLKKHTYIDAR
nr:hypothetical protein [Tanacetum cinerariifolium]